MNDFKHEKVSEHVFRIIDGLHVCCYLVVGKERACLIDTCNGAGNIREHIKEITDKPVFVILTHGHLDHIGGAGLFKEIYMSAEDIPVFQKHGDMDFRKANIKIHTRNQHEVTDLVPTYKGKIYNIQNKEIFDCGGVKIKVIPVKGHTPGMVCPLIIEDRLIVFGDACGEGVMLFDEFSSNVSEYKTSLCHLKTYEDQYDKIVRNHGSYESSKDLLDNVIECCNLILKKGDAHIPMQIYGMELYSCCELDNYKRIDGKIGNIFYSKEKSK